MNTYFLLEEILWGELWVLGLLTYLSFPLLSMYRSHLKFFVRTIIACIFISRRINRLYYLCSSAQNINCFISPFSSHHLCLVCVHFHIKITSQLRTKKWSSLIWGMEDPKETQWIFFPTKTSHKSEFYLGDGWVVPQKPLWNSDTLIYEGLKSRGVYVCVCACVCMLSRVWLFVTLCILVHQAPLSMEFSRQEYWRE